MSAAAPAVDMAPASEPSRWQFRWLLAAPHRIAFAAAATVLGASSVWWAAVMLARAFSLAWPWALPPPTVHGLLMTYGFMPMFFTGFLFTAGPKWLRVAPVQARTLVAPLALQLGGWGVLLLAAHGLVGDAGAAAGGPGLVLVASGWSWIGWRFLGLVRASRVDDRLHARLIALAAALGALALWSAAIALARGDYAAVRAATLGGLWGFIGLVYLAVADRMIPFFDGAVLPRFALRRPFWLLGSLVASFGLEAVLAIADALAGPPAPVRLALQAAFELPVGLGLLALGLRWGRLRNVRIRLLAMLYTGFVWLGLAFVLAGVSHALMSAGLGSLGLAPLHAYTMGFLGSTLIAMATRVSSGQSGRTVAADDFAWRLFWLLQFAVVARVAAGAIEGLGSAASGASLLLTVLAAFAWAGACATWALRYIGWFGRARADGRPG